MPNDRIEVSDTPIKIPVGQWDRVKYHLAFGDFVLIIVRKGKDKVPDPDKWPVPMGLDVRGACVRVVGANGRVLWDATDRLFDSIRAAQGDKYDRPTGKD